MNQKLASLDAMGIDVWVRRDFSFEPEIAETLEVNTVAESQPPISPSKQIEELETPPVLVEPSLDSASGNDLGLSTEVAPKLKPELISETEAQAIVEEIAPVDSGVIETVHISETEIAQSEHVEPEKPELAKTHQQSVLGMGTPDADCLILGEPSGLDASGLNELFADKEGLLLTAMLKSIGLNREQVFIGKLSESQATESTAPNQLLQISSMKPKVILCLGHAAAHNLLKIDTPLEKMRESTYAHEVLDIPIIVTYHPAYLLSSPLQKGQSWQDLLLAKSLLDKL